MSRSEPERRGLRALRQRSAGPLALVVLLLIPLSACGGGSAPPVAQVASPPPASSVPPSAPVLTPTPAIEVVQQAEPEPPPEFVPMDGPVEKTDSGLQYIDIQEGSGPTPESGQTVAVHYTGWLLNGTRFDSSIPRGQPLSFQLGTGRVIKGWEEGVSTMKVGGKRRLIIPPNLAYGSNGNGPIPPNATIVFDVELVAIAG